ATDGPSRNHRNDHFWHKADQPLYFQNIQTMVAILTHIALFPPSLLITARAKSPAAILGRRTFPTQKHDPDGGIFLRIVKSIVQFCRGFWAKSIPDFRSVESD